MMERLQSMARAAARRGLVSGVLLVVATMAHATGGLTLDVVDLEQLPEDVVNTIELPAAAADRPRDSAAHGLDTANRAREQRGNATAAEARDLGREFGERMAEEARSSSPGQQIREEMREHQPVTPRRPPRP